MTDSADVRTIPIIGYTYSSKYKKMAAINTATELQAFYEEHISYLTSSAKADLNILLMKDIKKGLKTGAKKTRAPKLDDDGNIIKQTLHEGMLTWRKFYKEINTRLLALTGQEKLPSMSVVRFSSVLKEAGHYYNDDGVLDLDDNFILQEYNKWMTLSDEEKFPNKKEKSSSAKSSKKTSVVQSSTATDVEASDVEEEAPKPKPKAKASKKVEKVEKVEEPVPVEEPVKKDAPVKKTKTKAESKVESEAETEKPKKTVAKKTK